MHNKASMRGVIRDHGLYLDIKRTTSIPLYQIAKIERCRDCSSRNLLINSVLRVSMGLTVRRKTAKNLAVRRKNERILAVSRKKN